jgi:regulator of replication initiation timing
MKNLEDDLNKSIEFQSSRIDELESKLSPIVEENALLKAEVDSLTQMVKQNSELLNKQERFSRRNNFRIVGVPATAKENCTEIVEEMLADNFNMADVSVERAHRDGRGHEGKSPHILVKVLSYRDKMDIMQTAKSVLKDEVYFIVDDLTKADLAEKKKWGQRVKQLYKEGTKLNFFAGKWRRNGQPFLFTE